MRLGLTIDLDTCVGCHACAVACKEWNGESLMAGPLPDYDPYGKEASGAWLNRIRSFEYGTYPENKTVNVPMSCLHCEDAACVTVCPTGASYKRDDGVSWVPQRDGTWGPAQSLVNSHVQTYSRMAAVMRAGSRPSRSSSSMSQMPNSSDVRSVLVAARHCPRKTSLS